MMSKVIFCRLCVEKMIPNVVFALVFQVRATEREDVAAHAEVLRYGEEREGPGGRACQEGPAVQATGGFPFNINTVRK